MAPRCKIVCSRYHSRLLHAHIFHLRGRYIQNILANLKTLSFFITDRIQSRVVNMAYKIVVMDLVWHGQSREVACRVQLQEAKLTVNCWPRGASKKLKPRVFINL